MSDDKSDEVVEIQLNGYQAVKAKGQIDRDTSVPDVVPDNYRSRPSNWWYQCFECLKLNNKTQFIPIQGNENETVHNKIKHPGALLRNTNTTESYGSR